MSPLRTLAAWNRRARTDRQRKHIATAYFEPLESRVLLSAGDLDPTFGTGGLVTTDFIGSSYEYSAESPVTAVQDDGKIIVALETTDAGTKSFGLARLNIDGTLDTSFGVDGLAKFRISQRRDGALDVALQSTGDIIVSGFSENSFVVARYDTNGILDPNFGSGGIATFDIAQRNTGGYIAIDGNNDILLAGTLYINSVNRNDIAVLRIDGSSGLIDSAFGSNGVSYFNLPTTNSSGQFARDIAIDGNGKILVTGYNDINRDGLVVRFNPSGDLDLTFGSSGHTLIQSSAIGSKYFFSWSISISSDNGVVISGGANIPGGLGMAKLDSTGAFDASFGSAGIVVYTGPYSGVNQTDHVVDSAGNITAVIRGAGLPFGSFVAVRFDSSGAVDTSFGSSGIAMYQHPTQNNESNSSISLLANGSIIISGSLTGNHTNDAAVIKIDSTGQLDSNFGSGGWALIDFPGSASDIAQDVVALQSDGKLVVGGHTADFTNFALTRYNQDGSLDTTFGVGGRVITDLGSIDDEGISALAVLPDGDILAVGLIYTLTGLRDFAIARYNPDGTLDSGFGVGGIVITDLPGGAIPSNDSAHSVAVADDGSFIVGGSLIIAGSVTGPVYAMVAVKYNANGTLDTTFSGDGVAYDYSDGRTFDGTVALANDGSVILGGLIRASRTQSPEIWVGKVTRFRPNGTIDTSFGTAGATFIDLPGTEDWINGLTLDASDRIILTGRAQTNRPRFRDLVVVRLDSDGSFDPSFGTDGIVTTAAMGWGRTFWYGTDVLIQPDGRIVVLANLNDDFAFIRFNENGSVDSTFGVSGISTANFSTDVFGRDSRDVGSSIAMQPDGKIVAVGYTFEFNSNTGTDFAIARIESGLVLIRPVVLSVDIGRDLKSAIIQFDDVDLAAVSATDVRNYTILAANGDANEDGDFFNDGDETALTITGAVYDAVTDQVVVSTSGAIFDDVFRVAIDGDGTSDGSPGVTSESGQHIAGGDQFIDFDLVSIGMVNDLLDTVEALGLSMGAHNSLVARLDSAVHLLGVDPSNNSGVIALMDSFTKGVQLWFMKGQISQAQRDSLFENANLIILGLTLLN